MIADGFSCRTQIAQATRRRALHLADVIEMAHQEGPIGPAGDFPERRYVPDYGGETISPAIAVASAASAGLRCSGGGRGPKRDRGVSPALRRQLASARVVHHNRTMAATPKRSLLAFAAEHSLPLPIGAAIALAWANVASPSYTRFAHVLEFPVNDIGMVFFFALAAKEVVEAMSPGGALHTWRRAALPVVSALGGMLGPALIYLAWVFAVREPALVRGWAIPCATDIAFSYMVARAVFGRHPAIPFLLLLAIADDAFGLVILAVFYPVGDLHLAAGVVLMACALGTAFVLRRRRTQLFWPYVFTGGALSWAALFVGGLHPALALVPIVPFLPHAARDPGLFVEAPAGARDALSEFEHWSKYPVQAVLFAFGLVNAGVRFEQVGPGTWAVFGAILAGKPIGIGAAVALATAAGLRLPSRLAPRDIVVVGFAAAIGFTVALFFATAAFPPGPYLDQTKLGALFSVGGGVVTFVAARGLSVGRFRVDSRESDGRSR